jgi:hypothetical protein
MTNDRTPQMRAISTNICPNAQPRSMTDVSACDLTAMTVWGYCTECWAESRVPGNWAAKVDARILTEQRP